MHTDWTWVQVTNAYTNAVATFPYTAGYNVFRMAWFHENVLVDRVLITNDPNFEPSEKREIANGRSIASLEKQETNNSIEVFPNPCKDKFMISYESATEQHAQITIQSTTSLIGKEIMVPLQVGLNNIPINMDSEEKGVYVLTILTSDGKRCLRKIVVTN